MSFSREEYWSMVSLSLIPMDLELKVTCCLHKDKNSKNVIFTRTITSY